MQRLVVSGSSRICCMSSNSTPSPPNGHRPEIPSDDDCGGWVGVWLGGTVSTRMLESIDLRRDIPMNHFDVYDVSRRNASAHNLLVCRHRFRNILPRFAPIFQLVTHLASIWPKNMDGKNKKEKATTFSLICLVYVRFTQNLNWIPLLEKIWRQLSTSDSSYGRIYSMCWPIFFRSHWKTERARWSWQKIETAWCYENDGTATPSTQLPPSWILACRYNSPWKDMESYETSSRFGGRLFSNVMYISDELWR